MSIVFGSS